jgi:hypothetical protein
MQQDLVSLCMLYCYQESAALPAPGVTSVVTSQTAFHITRPAHTPAVPHLLVPLPQLLRAAAVPAHPGMPPARRHTRPLLLLLLLEVPHKGCLLEVRRGEPRRACPGVHHRGVPLVPQGARHKACLLVASLALELQLPEAYHRAPLVGPQALLLLLEALQRGYRWLALLRKGWRRALHHKGQRERQRGWVLQRQGGPCQGLGRG